MKTACNTGLQDLLNDIEYLTSRGLRLLLSSSGFKYVQDTYQLPTAFDSKEKMQRVLLLQLDVTIGQLFTLMTTIITHHFLAFQKE
jgi:hypothetical protein